MISVDWSYLTILEMHYLLSNNEGHIDGDKKTIEISLGDSIYKELFLSASHPTSFVNTLK